MTRRDMAEADGPQAWLADWHGHLLSRRRFLLALAGGSLAALFPLSGAAGAPDEAARWRLLDAVQRHLLPSEPDAPGARELGALAYLRTILNEDPDKAEDRRFVLDGAGWLEDMAGRITGKSFGALDEARREEVLRRIEASEAGSNWLALLLLYALEAALADPVYGGNPGGAGWRWLEHIPGFPRPPRQKRYMALQRR